MDRTTFLGCRKLAALLPAYNEAHAIIGVLDKIVAYADYFIIVDDCSNDATVSVVQEWSREKQGVYLLALPQNVGASGALKAGYVFVAHLLKEEILSPDDLVLEIDSDGQHEPTYIPVLCRAFLQDPDLNVMLACRDFSVYPPYKRLGNWGLTLIASLLSGYSYRDVESNYRISRARIFPQLLEYFSGYRYSGAFEVGIILGSLEYQIRNDIVVIVPFYRHGASAMDGVHVLAMGLLAWLKVRLGLKNRNPIRECEVVGLLKTV